MAVMHGSVLVQEGRARRAAREALARQARRRRRIRITAAILGAGCVALLAFMASAASGPSTTGARTQQRAPAVPHSRTAPPPDLYGVAPAPAAQRVKVRLKPAFQSGLLFDVRTGKVLWERKPTRSRAIASLTKMMTALVVVAYARPSDRVLITRQAVHFSGSGVGLLPLGRRVPLRTLLYGLLLPSGNDAAIALAQHVAGTRARFIAMMNSRARAMGLGCTHFASVSGIVDQGNYSCSRDLARLAHAVLTQRVLAPIVATRNAALAFPIKGGKLWLYNNNPLLRLEYPGADGVKTGFTTVAGPCLVAAARRGRAWLGVVLLHSADPSDEAQVLLNAGFAALHAPAA
jgi:D-alanyl-D-alanine carboxypeptidase (penicillin-binding protein 5/6)